MIITLVKTDQFAMHWSAGFKHEKIALAMSMNRYETLDLYLHCKDNFNKDLPQNNHDKLFKINPLLDIIQKTARSSLSRKPLHR